MSVAEERLSGNVKFFSSEKGYGFIAAEDNKDYFVHFKDIQGMDDDYKKLNAGQQVSFVPSEGKRGLAALKVKALVTGNEG